MGTMLKNLLDIPVLGAVLRSTWTWRLLRIGLLALLLVMIAYGWHQHAIPGVAVRDPLMYTNLATFGLWVAWMMGMVFVALLFGRSWCTVCPVGWLNGLASRIGLRRELPAWLDNFVPVTLVLIGLQLLVFFFAIHRYPDYTALLLAWMVLLAVAAGLIFRPRAFCKLLCPAGAVMGLYARVAPWQLRVTRREVCAGCAEQSCISRAPRWTQAALGDLRLQWRSRPEGCPVDLVPAELEQSADCTLCLNCVHGCCNDNLKLGFRGWPGDLGRCGLRPSETIFFLVLLGLLTANFAKVHLALREAIFWLPEQLALALGWQEAGFYPLAALWVSLLLPFLLILPGLIVALLGRIRITTSDQPVRRSDSPAGAAGSLWGEGGWLGLAGRLAMPMLPLVLAAHLGLALVKLNAKAGYLPFAVQDPTGVKSFLAFSVMQTLPAPGTLVALDLLKWLIVGVLAAGLLVSVLAARTLAAERTASTAPSDRGRTFFLASLCNLLVLAALYGATVFEWLFVR